MIAKDLRTLVSGKWTDRAIRYRDHHRRRRTSDKISSGIKYCSPTCRPRAGQGNPAARGAAWISSYTGSKNLELRRQQAARGSITTNCGHHPVDRYARKRATSARRKEGRSISMVGLLVPTALHSTYPMHYHSGVIIRGRGCDLPFRGSGCRTACERPGSSHNRTARAAGRRWAQRQPVRDLLVLFSSFPFSRI